MYIKIKAHKPTTQHPRAHTQHIGHPSEKRPSFPRFPGRGRFSTTLISTSFNWPTVIVWASVNWSANRGCRNISCGRVLFLRVEAVRRTRPHHPNETPGN